MKSYNIPIKMDTLSKNIKQFDYEIIKFDLFKHVPSLNNFTIFLNHFKILIFLNGQYTVHVQDKVFNLKTNDMMFVAPNTYYSVSSQGDAPLEFYSLHFNIMPFHKISHFMDYFNLHNLIVLEHFLDEPTLTKLHHVKKMINQQKDGYYLSAYLLLFDLLLSIKTLSNDGNHFMQPIIQVKSGEEEIVNTCVDYIQNNLSQNIKVNDLCEICNVSQSYLYRCFKKLLNLSPSQFIIQYKIRKSEELLKVTDNSITSIAEDTGFSSIYLFSNAFKNITGLSPSQYRAKKNSV